MKSPLANFFAKYLALLVSCLVVGCAGDPLGRGRTNYSFGSESTPWEDSKAVGAAYAGEDFMFRKRQPIGAKNDYPFYFKHCDESGSESWYSKTSYECTGPLGR